MPSANPSGSRVLAQGAAASWVEGYRTRALSGEACEHLGSLDGRSGDSGESSPHVPYPSSRSGVQVATAALVVVALGFAALMAAWIISTLL